MLLFKVITEVAAEQTAQHLLHCHCDLITGFWGGDVYPKTPESSELNHISGKGIHMSLVPGSTRHNAVETRHFGLIRDEKEEDRVISCSKGGYTSSSTHLWTLPL